MNHPQHRQGVHPDVAAPAPSARDVLNGRGQGVQRHPGNVKYRTLVFVNKGLYAKCPRTDKIKISKGIVAAVRELGGRFLELDERTRLHYDIGDKKATEKTSQALREGQKKIRKQIYKDEENMMAKQMHDVSLLASGPSQDGRGISSEGYFRYSVQVLESLYRADDNENASRAPASAQLLPVQSQTLASRAGGALQPPPTFGLPAGFADLVVNSDERLDGRRRQVDLPLSGLGNFPGPPPMARGAAGGEGGYPTAEGLAGAAAGIGHAPADARTGGAAGGKAKRKSIVKRMFSRKGPHGAAPVPNAVTSDSRLAHMAMALDQFPGADSSLAHMAMALDQFPGAMPAPPPQKPEPRVPDAASMPPPPPQRQTLSSDMRRSVGRFTDEISRRGSIAGLGRRTLSRLSFTGTSSIGQMLGLARGEPRWTAGADRNSIESILDAAVEAEKQTGAGGAASTGASAAPPPPARDPPPSAAAAAPVRSASAAEELSAAAQARLSNISFTSTSSINQMLELARGEHRWTADGHRSSIESILSDEIRDLIRLSEPQLNRVEHMTMDELVHRVNEIHVEAEMENAARMDRVSDLRFTDLSSGGAGVDDGDVADAQLLLRLSNGI